MKIILFYVCFFFISCKGKEDDKVSFFLKHAELTGKLEKTIQISRPYEYCMVGKLQLNQKPSGQLVELNEPEELKNLYRFNKNWIKDSKHLAFKNKKLMSKKGGDENVIWEYCIDVDAKIIWFVILFPDHSGDPPAKDN